MDNKQGVISILRQRWLLSPLAMKHQRRCNEGEVLFFSTIIFTILASISLKDTGQQMSDNSRQSCNLILIMRELCQFGAGKK